MEKFDIQEMTETLDGTPQVIELMQTSSNQWKSLNHMDCETSDLTGILNLIRINHSEVSGLLNFDRQRDIVYLYCAKVEGTLDLEYYKISIERNHDVTRLTLWKRDNPLATPPQSSAVVVSPSTFTTPTRRTPTRRTPPRITTPTSASRGVHNPRNITLFRYLRIKRSEPTSVACVRSSRGAERVLNNDVLYNFQNALNVVKNATLTITKDNFETFSYIGVKSRGQELTNIGQLVLDFFEGI